MNATEFQMEIEMANARILVVEDEPYVGELVCELLDIHGFDGTHVLLGRDGIDRAQEMQPDAVVLDLMLPDVDGFEVCRTLRREDASATCPVVMLTAMQTTADRKRGFEAGADRFLTKPFRPEDLIEELHSVIEEYQTTERGGLRRRVQVNLRDCASAPARIAETLMRTTPLSPEQIDGVSAVVRDLCARNRQVKADCQLSIEVFRDRIVSTLSCAGQSPVASAEIFRTLLGAKDGSETLSYPSAISEESNTSEAGDIVMTRHFVR